MRLSHTFLRNYIKEKGGYAPTNRKFEGLKKEDEVFEDELKKDYRFMQRQFKAFLKAFEETQRKRHNKRNIHLNIPFHVDYIEITFFKSFGGSLEMNYRDKYGIVPIKYNYFNQNVFFAIIDNNKFERFKKELKAFINAKDVKQEKGIDFHGIITLIKEFYFYGSEKIKESCDSNLTYLQLVDNPEIDTNNYLLNQLLVFLQENKVVYYYDSYSNTIEIRNVNEGVIDIIADNFDIVYKINSIRTTKVSASKYGQIGRNYSFKVSLNENTPIVGIIDTGISDLTPLADLILNNDDYDLTNTGAQKDTVVHGTSVACLAALGSQIYNSTETKTYYSDARLLSIKVLDNDYGYLARSEVLDLIRKAYKEYNVRIFTLTITENHRELKYNEAISKYGYLLDKLSYELDILIFISVGNFSKIIDLNKGKPVEYPQHFKSQLTNLEAPSDSMNNLSVGAIADNFESNYYGGLTPNKSYPAIYSRTYNFNFETSGISVNQKNKHLFKPDVVHHGGDYSGYPDYEYNGLSALKLLSSALNADGGFHRHLGTSFSVPLIANIASKILRQYPRLNMQSVKALIINSSSYAWGTKSVPKELEDVKSIIKHLKGHGLPNEERCLWSNPDEITLFIEDEIFPKEYKTIPVKVPQYLTEMNHKKGVLEITATLCFSFLPVEYNHMAYCPIHITYGFFQMEKLIEKKKDGRIKMKKLEDIKVTNFGWVEDYYYKRKLLSNVQKVSFNLSKKYLLDQNCEFQVGIKSSIHKLLNIPIRNHYEKRHSFSLVINIKEKPLGGKTQGRLYNEMQAINKLEVISELKTDAYLDI